MKNLTLNKAKFIIVFLFFTWINSAVLDLEYKESNGFYTIQMSLGKNGQTFSAQIDTTTSEIWVPSKNTSLEAVDIQRYDTDSSKSAELTKRIFEIDGERGSVKGFATFDSVEIGQFYLKRMGFVQVTEFTMDFHDYLGGKLGLGYRQEHGDEFDWLRELKKNNLIKYEMFTINPEEQQLIIGEFPSDYNMEEYSFCNLTEVEDLDDKYRAGWVCEMTHIFCGVDTDTRSLETALDLDSRVIFDSGYNYISIPIRHLEKFKTQFLHKLFDDSCLEFQIEDHVSFVCDNDDHIPQSSIAFVIGGKGYIIRGENLFKQIEDDKYEMLIRFRKENDNIITLGTPFFNQFSITFDSENKHVGFYGGETINVKKEWDGYMSGDSIAEKEEKMKKLMILICVFGGILLLIVVCLIIKSCRKQSAELVKYENKDVV